MYRLKAPFFFKLRYYKPNFKNQAKNIAHLRYISSRSGVDKGEPNFEEEVGAIEHMKYMNERPRSHGLFGPEENTDLKSAIKEVSDHEGFTWRAIISLKEDDAIRLGYTEREAWEKMLRASMNEVAGKMGIRETNLKWFAAFHQEQGHPHCHILFWEKVPERFRWTKKQSAEEIKKMRKVFIQRIYADERQKLGHEQTALRELLGDKTKVVVQETTEAEIELKAMLGENPGIPPKIQTGNDFDEEQLKYLQSRLNELAKKMPGKGRAMLAFMPPEVKEEVGKIADWLMRQPQMKSSVKRIGEIAREFSAPYSFQKKYHDQAAENALKDIQERLSQIVLKGAAEINKAERKLKYEETKARRDAQHEKTTITNGVWKSAWRALERERSKAEAQRELAKRKEAWRSKLEHEQEEQNKKRER